MFRDRLPSPTNIVKRNGPSDGNCVMCGAHEDANHIFFNCHLARFAWSAVREAFDQNWNPHSSSDLRGIFLAHRGGFGRVLWRCVGALIWALWTTRNKFTIKHVFPSKPADCLFKSCIFLQQWRLLTKPGDRDALDLLISKVRASATSLSGLDPHF